MTKLLAANKERPTEAEEKAIPNGWLLEAILVVSCVIFVVLRTQTPLIIAVSAFTIGVALWALYKKAAAQRQLLSASAMIALLVAIPINRIPAAGHLLLTVCIAVFIIGLAGLRVRGSRLPRGTIAVVGVLAVMAFVTVLSPDKSAMLLYLPFIASVLPIYIVVGQSNGNTRRRISRFVVTIAAIESVLSLVEPRFFPGHLWAPAQLGSLGQVVPLYNPLLHNAIERSQGTLGHPLTLGFVLLVGIALLVRAFPGAKLTPRILGIVLLLAGLLMSGSRNSLIIAGVILLYFLGGRITPIRAIISTLIAAFGVGLAISASWLSAAAQQEFADSGSYTHRLGAYGAIGRLLSDQPVAQVLFGNGYASTSRLFGLGLQTDGFNVVDNEFILTLALGGVVSLIIVALLSVAAFVFCKPEIRPAVAAVIGTMVIFDTFSWPSVTILSFAIFGMALNPRSESSGLILVTSQGKAIV